MLRHVGVGGLARTQPNLDRDWVFMEPPRTPHGLCPANDRVVIPVGLEPTSSRVKRPVHIRLCDGISSGWPGRSRTYVAYPDSKSGGPCQQTNRPSVIPVGLEPTSSTVKSRLHCLLCDGIMRRPFVHPDTSNGPDATYIIFMRGPSVMERGLTRSTYQVGHGCDYHHQHGYVLPVGFEPTLDRV